MKITIPRLTTTNAISFCQTLPYIEQNVTYWFDVSDTNKYEPLPMLLTASAIRRFCYERSIMPHQIELIYNNDLNYQYACHMGFFQAAGFPQGKAPGEAHGSQTYIPLTRMNISELMQKAIDEGNYVEQGDIIELKAKQLSKVLSQNSDELQKLLQYLLREAIRNIPEHAETSDVWLCGQYWHTLDLAEIAILDEGIGVFESLSRNSIHRDYISSNEEALWWALKPGVSTSFDPARGQKSVDVWANSGYGLYMISEICKKTDGWFTFISGDDCLRVYSNRTSTNKANHKGTALGIRIKPSKIIKCKSIIDDIRRMGEQEAKMIKNSFREASLPSKGLLY